MDDLAHGTRDCVGEHKISNIRDSDAAAMAKWWWQLVRELR